ncbi:uncharacterized protein LOC131939263 [Physella acuta]|uniref:uncharacterized protein LOC131939263 n=1 Tax=Physella acuta TaxID=109671 RepID=UPI0027DBB23E|nr:uncharacterized protein LOC131939263 [Physella acuta]
METPWIVVFVACLTQYAASECLMTDDRCEFWLVIEQKLTMMYGKELVYPKDGQIFINPTLKVDSEKVITADAFMDPLLVITANGTMPGPPIEVYEGQTITVHVRNDLISDAVTVHWHGLHQVKTPWMDGVPFVTQLPILPGSEFTYKFKASPIGTFWYHSHMGTQLSSGLFGAFIIRAKVVTRDPEFVMILQDWNHFMVGDTTYFKMQFGVYENKQRIPPSTSFDGGKFSMFRVHSILVNGKGRFDAKAPLAVYEVEPYKRYRFRVISAANNYPLIVSIDIHPFEVVASDGYPIRPQLVDALIINPGERYDFIVRTLADNLDNYWIRIQTLENNTVTTGWAILRYKGATDRDPYTSPRLCTRTDICRVLNCPFSYFPLLDYKTCINFDQIQSFSLNYPPARDSKDKIEEIFLNFAFPGTGDYVPGSVNGRRFEFPSVVALDDPKNVTSYCKPDQCGEEELCNCTYSINLKHNATYQLILLNKGVGKGWTHPIHLHGHSFYLVKMGYPKFDEKTGLFLGENTDINCTRNSSLENSFCNKAFWANSSWGGNNIEGIELDYPPIKDTIIVPSGGYAVIRIRADNPGVWFMHCHIELHHVNGMALMFNESFDRDYGSVASSLGLESIVTLMSLSILWFVDLL